MAFLSDESERIYIIMSPARGCRKLRIQLAPRSQTRSEAFPSGRMTESNSSAVTEPRLVSGSRESSAARTDAATKKEEPGHRKRLLIVAPHVVQYSSPLFREMAHHPALDVLVAYCSMQGAEAVVDPGFGVKVSWDTPLLEGYSWTSVPNRAWRPGSDHFFGLFNPGLWALIRDGRFDAVLICGYYFASAWIAVCAAKRFGVPIIFVSDSHGLESWRARSNWRLRVKKRLVRWIFSLSDGVVVSSSGGVEYLKSLGYPAKRISLAPTAVNNFWWLEQAEKADRRAV